MPASNMLRTTWAQLDSTTLSEFSGELVDNITNNQILLWMMNQLGGVVYKRGITIREPIIIEDNASVHWYAGYDPLDMSNNEGITMAEYAYKQLGGVMQLNGFEQWANEGTGQIIDLWDAKGQQLGITMKKRLNTALFADGTADGNKAVVGLQTAVQFLGTGNVYGGIDSSVTTFWQNYYANGNNINATGPPTGSDNVFSGLRNMILSTTAGNDRGDLVVMDQTVYQVFLAGLEGKQQLVRAATRQDEAMANAGFENTVFMGIPHVWDVDVQPQTNVASGSQSSTAGRGAILLNLKYARFIFGEDMDFKFSDPISPDNQDAASVKCLMYGNFALRNRRRQGRVNFATS